MEMEILAWVLIALLVIALIIWVVDIWLQERWSKRFINLEENKLQRMAEVYTPPAPKTKLTFSNEYPNRRPPRMEKPFHSKQPKDESS